MLATAGVKGFAFTLLRRHARLAVHRGARHLGDPRHDGAHAHHALAPHAGRRQGAHSLALRLHGQLEVVLLDVRRDPARRRARDRAASALNFGIDFESGTRITTPVQQAASVAQVRNALAPLGYGDAKIQTVKDAKLGKHVFQITVKKLPPDKVEPGARTRSTRSSASPGRTSPRTRSGRPSAPRSPGRR